MKKLLQRLVLALTLLASCQMAMAQTRQITGKVTDATGSPLIGVSVVVHDPDPRKRARSGSSITLPLLVRAGKARQGVGQ